jgi:hypothetical protein
MASSATRSEAKASPMNRTLRPTFLYATAALLLGLSSVASAQATRTWVSGVGDDLNPCSRTAPCKTFAGAISKTAAGGEIDALDPGGFGAVTITKSITIDGSAGNVGSILASATNAINISGAGIKVTLKNLSINGAGASLGLIGVRVLEAAEVTLHNVTIENFSQEGIRIAPTTSALVKVVLDGVSVQRTQFGLRSQPGAGTSADISVARSHFSNNSAAGIRVDDRTSIAMTDATLNGNATVGFNAVGLVAGGTVDAALTRVVSSHNGVNAFVAQSQVATSRVSLSLNESVAAFSGSDGVFASGADAQIRMTGNKVLDNGGIGINAAGGSHINSGGGNVNAGNSAPGGPTGVLSVQ